MWTPRVLILGLALASALAWKPNNEYQYDVMVKTLTSPEGITDSATGHLIRSTLVVQPQDDQTRLIAALTKTEIAEIKDIKIVDGEIPESAVEGLNWRTYEAKALEKPFEITLQDGLVKGVKINRAVPMPTQNLMRALVSAIQIDITGKNRIPSKMNSFPENELPGTQFKTIEESPTGKCEILYGINPLPLSVAVNQPGLIPLERMAGKMALEVTKTTNYTNCLERPVYNYGLPRGENWEAATNNMETFFTRSGYQRIILSGPQQDYTIQSSLTVEKIVIDILQSGDRDLIASVWSSVQLKINSVSAVSEPMTLSENLQEIESLVYQYSTEAKYSETQYYNDDNSSSSEEDTNEVGSSSSSSSSSSESQEDNKRQARRQRVQPITKLSEKPDAIFSPFGNMLDSVRIVRDLALRIAKDLQTPSEIPAKGTLATYTTLVEVARIMSQKEMTDATRQLYAKQQTNPEGKATIAYAAWLAWRDAVPQAGTGPALLTIQSWIENRQVEDLEAAQLMATLLKSTRVPSPEYMNAVMDVLKKTEVEDRRSTWQQTALSFAQLLRNAHVDRETAHNRYPAHVYGLTFKQTEKDLVEKFLPYFEQKLQAKVQEKDIPMILTLTATIAEIAHPTSVRILKQYISQESPLTTFQRTQTIVAMSRMAETQPKLLISVLNKVYSNKAEEDQVRVAAVFGLLNADLPVYMLQRMAIAVHEEPSYQVRAAVQTGIESMARLEGRREWHKKALAAVPLLPRERYNQYTMQNFTDFVSQEQGIDRYLSQDLFTINSEDSIIPNALFYRLAAQENGAALRPFQAKYMISSPRELLRGLAQVLEQFNPSFKQYDTKHQYQVVTEILKKINVAEDERVPFESVFQIDMAGVERTFAVDSQAAQRLQQLFAEKIRQYIYGAGFVHQKMYLDQNIELALPTASGIPMIYSLKSPVLMSVNGVIRVTPDSTLEQFTVKPDVRAVWSKLERARVAVFSPASNKHFESRLDTNALLNVRIDGELTSKRMEDGIYEVSAVFNPKKEQSERVLHLSTWPSLSQRSAEDFRNEVQEETKYIHVRKPTTYKTVVAQDALPLDIQLQTERDLTQVWARLRNMDSQDIESFLASPQSFLGMEHSRLDVFTRPEEARVDEIRVTLAVKVPKPVLNQEQHKAEPKYELPRHVYSQQWAQQAFNYVYPKVTEGLKNSQPILVAFSYAAKQDEQVKQSVVAVFAGAKSQADEQAHVIFNLNVNDVNVSVDSVAYLPFHPSYDCKKIVEEKKDAHIKTKVAWQYQGEPEAHVYVQGELQQSKAYKQHILEHHEQAKTYKGRQYAQIIKDAGKYDHQKWTIEQENVSPSVYEYIYKMKNYFEYVAFPYHQSTTYQKVSPIVKIELQGAKDLQSYNLTLLTPFYYVTYVNVPVPELVQPFFYPNTMQTPVQYLKEYLFQDQYTATAFYGKNYISTFSNYTYPAHFQGWHVLLATKPQYQQVQGSRVPRDDVAPFVLLGNENHEIKAHSADGQVFKLVPKENSVEVHLNNEQITEFPYITKDVQIYRTPYGEVKMVLPHVEIKHNIKYVQVSVDHQYRGQIVGLFGQYEGNYKYDLVTPQEKYVKLEALIASYAVEPQGKVAELQHYAQTEGVAFHHHASQYVSEQDAGRADSKGRLYNNPKKGYYSNDGSSSSSSSSSEEDKNNEILKGSKNCSVKRIHYVKHQNLDCFLQKPTYVCRPGCTATKTQLTRGSFYCAQPSQTSEHWVTMVMKGASPDFSKKPSTEIMYDRPVECSM